MLVHHLQCRSSIGPTSGFVILMFARSNLQRIETLSRPLGYERVYLPFCKVADTPFHIQGDQVSRKHDDDSMLAQCWASVVGGGPTLNQNWANV